MEIKRSRSKLPLRNQKKTGGATSTAVSWLSEHVRPERKLNYTVGDVWKNGDSWCCLSWIWPDGLLGVGGY
jgi:hypothetical protein